MCFSVLRESMLSKAAVGNHWNCSAETLNQKANIATIITVTRTATKK